MSIGGVICAGASFLPWMNVTVSCSVNSQILDVVIYPHLVDGIFYACIAQIIMSALFCSLIWKLAVTPDHKRLSKTITLLFVIYGVGIYFYVSYIAILNDMMTTYAKNSYVDQYGACGTFFTDATTTFWRQSHSASIYLQITAIVGCLLRHMCCSPSSKYC